MRKRAESPGSLVETARRPGRPGAVRPPRQDHHLPGAGPAAGGDRELDHRLPVAAGEPDPRVHRQGQRHRQQPVELRGGPRGEPRRVHRAGAGRRVRQDLRRGLRHGLRSPARPHRPHLRAGGAQGHHREERGAGAGHPAAGPGAHLSRSPRRERARDHRHRRAHAGRPARDRAGGHGQVDHRHRGGRGRQLPAPGPGRDRGGRGARGRDLRAADHAAGQRPDERGRARGPGRPLPAGAGHLA